ncbi:hypothetical protein [Stenotrophomonas rhizophila]|jgi:hypothetical protein|uniref:Uncharacterized protein n=1 Tax=Stenotrophomonas rhizophila TaxID=216778 RepID=A0AAW5PKQ3_9GAMM|nr:hypothetical protein [Stenotrophomonas rhizophila]MCS4280531.1 hypothetical protein [Stenotrophomonas rhizophila]
MQTNVQQQRAKSIGQSPDAHSEKSDSRVPADGRHDWLREEWRRSGHADHFRLEGIDRALHAAQGVQGLLLRDQRGRSLEACAPEELFHDGLDPVEVESLHEAVQLILCAAIDNLEYLRTGRVG